MAVSAGPSFGDISQNVRAKSYLPSDGTITNLSAAEAKAWNTIFPYMVANPEVLAEQACRQFDIPVGDYYRAKSKAIASNGEAFGKGERPGSGAIRPGDAILRNGSKGPINPGLIPNPPVPKKTRGHRFMQNAVYTRPTSEVIDKEVERVSAEYAKQALDKLSKELEAKRDVNPTVRASDLRELYKGVEMQPEPETEDVEVVEVTERDCLNQVIDALEGLDEKIQRRIVNAALVFLGVSISQ